MRFACGLAPVCAQPGRDHRYFRTTVAYVILLDRFRESLQELSKFLQIVPGTLLARLRRAAESVRFQPTLFDGIDAIDPDFIVHPARPKAAPRNTHPIYEQTSWLF